jgi:hypothetical protein
MRKLMKFIQWPLKGLKNPDIEILFMIFQISSNEIDIYLNSAQLALKYKYFYVCHIILSNIGDKTIFI